MDMDNTVVIVGWEEGWGSLREGIEGIKRDVEKSGKKIF